MYLFKNGRSPSERCKSCQAKEMRVCRVLLTSAVFVNGFGFKPLRKRKSVPCSEAVFGNQQDSVTHGNPPAKPRGEQKTTACCFGAAAGCSVIGGFCVLKWICCRNKARMGKEGERNKQALDVQNQLLTNNSAAKVLIKSSCLNTAKVNKKNSSSCFPSFQYNVLWLHIPADIAPEIQLCTALGLCKC